MQDGVWSNLFYQTEDRNFRLSSLSFKGLVDNINKEHLFSFCKISANFLLHQKRFFFLLGTFALKLSATGSYLQIVERNDYRYDSYVVSPLISY